MGKVGIMGGTFNPIHLAHLEMARCAMEQKELQKVLFMPSKIPPHKRGQSILSGQFRAEMVKLAISGKNGFFYSDFELKREGVTYTAKTLEQLCGQYPEDTFYFIMGGDSLFQFEQWYQPEKILQHAVVLAAARNEIRQEEMLSQAVYLSRKYDGDVQVVKMPKMEISSSMIREKISKGEDVREYLPEKVYEYIQRNHCYCLTDS